MEHAIPTALFYVCFFLLVISAIEHYFKRVILPPVCWILIGGLIYGSLNEKGMFGLPVLAIDPDVVFFLFLPMLIFDSARKLHLKELRSVGLEAGVFATVGVLVSMFIFGGLLVAFTDIPFKEGLLIGVILSATDPIAVAAIFSSFTIPERLKTLVEGESLLNDGTVVVLFFLLSKSVLDGTTLAIGWTALELFKSVGGAVVLGVVMGLIGGGLLRHWKELHDRFIGALLPLVAIYLTFGFAERVFHVSGVIATMTATLVLVSLHRSSRKRDEAGRSDLFFDGLWDFLGHLANAVLFFILGAEIGRHDFSHHSGLVFLVIVIAVVARSAVVYGGGVAFKSSKAALPMPWQHVLNLGGLKGALSVALILLIPETYEHRTDFLYTAYGVIFFSMIVNTLLMWAYLRRTPLD